MRRYKCQSIRVAVALLAVILLVGAGVLGAAAAKATTPDRVYVGGMPFGVKFYTEGILVVGFCDVDTRDGSVNPAKDAGLRARDIIIRINGQAPTDATALTTAVEASDGKPVTLTVKRENSKKLGPDGRTMELTLSVTPAFSLSENRYKTGMWVRDSGAGIGTVTFILPDTKAFAGLGHGICDGDTGDLVAMRRGQVTNVTVSGVERGEVGAPGAIKGYFAPGKTGSLLGNTDCGVFGVLTALPSTADRLLPVGHKNEVHEGEATILCTLDDGKIGEYTVRITSVDANARGSKCFGITVTDPALIAKTGGIVQGMSGSPVIQDGKLIGAVTHVMINDPQAGYGIFIDNMLAEMGDLC